METKVKVISNKIIEDYEHGSFKEATNASIKSTSVYKELIKDIKHKTIDGYCYDNNVLTLLLCDKRKIQIYIENDIVNINFSDETIDFNTLNYPSVLNINFSGLESYTWELKKTLDAMINSKIGSVSVADGMVFMSIQNLGSICFSVVCSENIVDEKLLFFSKT